MTRILRNTIISSLVAIAVYLFIYYSETSEVPNLGEQWIGLLLAIFLVSISGYALMMLNSWYNKMLPWNERISLRFFVELISGIIISCIAATIFIFTYVYLTYPSTEISLLDFIIDGLIKFGILTIVIIYGYSLINFSIYSYNQYSVGQIEALASERVQLDLRFEALKSQLNPHFLFNALNTISSLIYMDINQADSYIRQLARTYDYILSTNESKLVKLKDEIEMIKAYFFMHKIRFDEFVELEIDERLGDMYGYIPPFTLQILVENALKHSVISEITPLKIEIFGNNGSHLIVRNNIVEKPEVQSTMDNLLNKVKESDSYNIGLSNITNRYMHLINKDIEVTSGKYFTVKLPIISKIND